MGTISAAIFGGKALRILLVLTAAIFIAGGVCIPNQAGAACDPPFVQVNEDGFGGTGARFNIYSWAMKDFNSTTGYHLYVATWGRALVGADIWRYDGSTWEQLVDRGKGNRNNKGVRNLTEYNGALYAGVWNRAQGAEIWRTFNGTTWETVVTAGFGDPTNESIRSMVEFDGYLYAGTHNPSGAAQLWRTTNGTDWEAVNANGLGDPTNNSIHDLQVFGGMLYASTRNEVKGAQIWRSSDGVNFQVVVGDGAATPSGFGDPSTDAILDTEIFNGYMYVGTLNFASGFDMRRTADGVNYEKVGESGFGYGDCAAYVWRLGVFEGRLWMGGLNTCTGGTIWRTQDGTNWEQLVGDEGIVPGGFGDPSNWGIRSIGVYNDKLYFGTAECFFNDCVQYWDGTEVWEWQGECASAAGAIFSPVSTGPKDHGKDKKK